MFALPRYSFVSMFWLGGLVALGMLIVEPLPDMERVVVAVAAAGLFLIGWRALDARRESQSLVESAEELARREK